jgi:hypothetical protein
VRTRFVAAPGIDRIKQRLEPRAVGRRHEHPAALLAPLGQPRVGQDPHMPRHPRLALSQDMRQLPDRQLHRPQQRNDPQPGRIGESAKDVEHGFHLT